MYNASIHIFELDRYFAKVKSTTLDSKSFPMMVMMMMMMVVVMMQSYTKSSPFVALFLLSAQWLSIVPLSEPAS
jgi:hypothetical protein